MKDKMDHLFFPALVTENYYNNRANFKNIFFKNASKLFNKDGFSNESTGHLDIQTINEFKPFFNYVSSCINDYVNKMNIDTSIYNINITKCWLNILNEEDATPAHEHRDAHYSFSYYLNMPENNNQPLVFQRPTNELGNDGYHGMTANEAFKLNEVNTRTNAINVQEGSLCIFPSHMTHFTGAGKSEPVKPDLSKPKKKLQDVRICIAGDTLLTLKNKHACWSGVQPVHNWLTFS